MDTINSDVRNELFVQMALESWNGHARRFDKFLESATAEQMSREIAPGKNTGTYLLGHLTAVTDGLLPLLGLQDKLYPELTEPFIIQPDKSGNVFPSFEELKSQWEKVTGVLSQHFATMDTPSWMNRHTSVSEEDFAKEPHRNKLNVLLSRTNHQAYHFGQIVLLESKEK